MQKPKTNKNPQDPLVGKLPSPMLFLSNEDHHPSQVVPALPSFFL